MKDSQGKKIKNAAVVVKIIFFLIFVAVFIVLVYKNVYPSGRLELDYQIGGSRPLAISSLEPQYRVSKPKVVDGKIGQVLVSNPVYFNLRTVLPFKKAKIWIEYKNPSNQTFRVGGLVNNELWQFDLKEIKGELQESGWLVGQAEFDLRGYFRLKNQYRFILSVPYVELEDQNEGLVISRLHLELSREPLSFGAFWQKLFNKIKVKVSFL